MSRKSFNPRLAPRLPLLLSMCLTLSSIAACAPASSTPELRLVAATAADLKVVVPATARKPCEGANLPAPPKPGEVEYQVFGVKMVGQLDICEDKRALAVEAGDLHNRYVDKLAATLNPPSLWDRMFGR